MIKTNPKILAYINTAAFNIATKHIPLSILTEILNSDSITDLKDHIRQGTSSRGVNVNFTAKVNGVLVTGDTISTNDTSHTVINKTVPVAFSELVKAIYKSELLSKPKEPTNVKDTQIPFGEFLSELTKNPEFAELTKMLFGDKNMFAPKEKPDKFDLKSALNRIFDDPIAQKAEEIITDEQDEEVINPFEEEDGEISWPKMTPDGELSGAETRTESVEYFGFSKVLEGLLGPDSNMYQRAKWEDDSSTEDEVLVHIRPNTKDDITNLQSAINSHTILQNSSVKVKVTVNQFFILDLHTSELTPYTLNEEDILATDWFDATYYE